MGDIVLKIKDLCVRYEKGDYVLNKVNLQVTENDFLGIIGPNGGGKTTLLKCIMGLKQPTEGSITFYHQGKALTSRPDIGYMPQFTQIDKKFPISVQEVIASGLSQSGRLWGGLSAEQKKSVQIVAEQMGLQNFLQRPIGSLSGGQLQRVLLGRSIVNAPRILILDEPNSYVDKKFESDFYKLLLEINRSTTIILVSHDIGSVVSLVKNIACVNESLHYHQGSDLTSEWIEKAYSYPIDIVGHQPINTGKLPFRMLHDHENCNCGK